MLTVPRRTRTRLAKDEGDYRWWKQGRAQCGSEDWLPTAADRLAGLESVNVVLIPLGLEACRHLQLRDLIVRALDHLNHGNSRDKVMPTSRVNLGAEIGPSRNQNLPRFTV